MGAEKDTQARSTALDEKHSTLVDTPASSQTTSIDVSKSEEIASAKGKANGKEDTAGKDKDDKEKKPPIPEGYRTFLLGVYSVVYSPRPPLALPGVASFVRAKALVDTTARSTAWFLREIYAVHRVRVSVMLALNTLWALIPTVLLYLTNRMLNLIETGLKTNQIDTRAITKVLIARSVVSVLSLILYNIRNSTERKLKSQIGLHFRHLRLKAGITRTRNAPPDEENTGDDVLACFNAYRTARTLAELANTALAAASESVLMYQMLQGGRLAPLMLAVWALQALPAFDTDENRMWSQGAAYHVVNKDYIRLMTMENMAMDQFARQEVLGLNLGGWIIDEYERCRDELQGVDLTDPWNLLRGTESLFRLILSDICQEWPTLYYTFSALFGWASFSFATISSVQTQSWSLRYKFARLFGQDSDSFAEILTSVHKYVEVVRATPDAAEEAAAPYPGEGTHAAGMALEFRDVTFSYPNSKAKKAAIKELSVTIKPGQLVVIVGENGSGKSTLTKLLTRLHEPTSGTVLIDGRPAQDFKRAELREATAALSQDHNLLSGFSVAEDVGLGRWQHRGDAALVARSLELGGATAVVAKLAAGADTVLHPRYTKSCMGLTVGHPLSKYYETLETWASVSGGEQQRLVAARTFMRMNTGDVKLVVVDEPSAAMDPAAELALFTNLREARAGKTMVFITHRFGHLTKHADLVLCMKDGQLEEQGTHAELIARQGEYHKLYQVQAQAFAMETSADAKLTTTGDATKD